MSEKENALQVPHLALLKMIGEVLIQRLICAKKQKPIVLGLLASTNLFYIQHIIFIQVPRNFSVFVKVWRNHGKKSACSVLSNKTSILNMFKMKRQRGQVCSQNILKRCLAIAHMFLNSSGL